MQQAPQQELCTPGLSGNLLQQALSLRDCLKNACSELILVNKPHSVHMPMKFTYTMLRCCMSSRHPSPHYGTGSDPCTQPLLSSLCPHSTSANSCFTRHSHAECQLANPDERQERAAEDLGSTNVSFRLRMAGLPQLPCFSFPFRKSKLGIKKQGKLLALLQEAMLERENLKCCTTWKTETSLSGRWDNTPPVNTLKTST